MGARDWAAIMTVLAEYEGWLAKKPSFTHKAIFGMRQH